MFPCMSGGCDDGSTTCEKNVVDMGSILRRDVKARAGMALDLVPGGFGFICAGPLSCRAVS